jgi:hypothetical protein
MSGVIAMLYDGPMRDACSFASWVADVGSIPKTRLGEQPVKALPIGVRDITNSLDPGILKTSHEAYSRLKATRVDTKWLERWGYGHYGERAATDAVLEGMSRSLAVAIKDDVANTVKERLSLVRYNKRITNLVIIDEMVDDIISWGRFSQTHTFVKGIVDSPYTFKLGKTLVQVFGINETLLPPNDSIFLSFTKQAADKSGYTIPDIMPEDAYMLSQPLWAYDHKDLVGFFGNNGSSLPDPFSKEYLWMRAFDFEYGNALPDVIPVCPVGGLDPMFQLLFRKVGSATVGDSATILFKNMAQRLVSGYTPQDINETVIKSLLDTPLGADPKLLHDALEYMGCPSKKVSLFVGQVQSLLGLSSIHDKSSGYSTRDSIIGNMATDRANLERIVKLPSIPSNLMRANLLGLGFFIFLVDKNSKGRRLIFKTHGNVWVRESMRELMRRQYPIGRSLWQYYPDTAF